MPSRLAAAAAVTSDEKTKPPFSEVYLPPLGLQLHSINEWSFFDRFHLAIDIKLSIPFLGFLPLAHLQSLVSGLTTRLSDSDNSRGFLKVSRAILRIVGFVYRVSILTQEELKFIETNGLKLLSKL
ncbi:unnamed protein product [Lactuca virosa]|uniref:Uncharacterized protein n=1 Tax=Lactuca virosa TaxID=75947 RepID=A0AAU9N0H3_9ASTR|nr:unnamed protein product [Lactuca virosa]